MKRFRNGKVYEKRNNLIVSSQTGLKKLHTLSIDCRIEKRIKQKENVSLKECIQLRNPLWNVFINIPINLHRMLPPNNAVNYDIPFVLLGMYRAVIPIETVTFRVIKPTLRHHPD